MDDGEKLRIAQQQIAEIDAEYRRIIVAVSPGLRALFSDLGAILAKAKNSVRDDPGIPIYHTELAEKGFKGIAIREVPDE